MPSGSKPLMDVEILVLGRDEGLLDERRNRGRRQIEAALARIFGEQRCRPPHGRGSSPAARNSSTGNNRAGPARNSRRRAATPPRRRRTRSRRSQTQSRRNGRCRASLDQNLSLEPAARCRRELPPKSNPARNHSGAATPTRETRHNGRRAFGPRTPGPTPRTRPPSLPLDLRRFYVGNPPATRVPP